MFYSSFTLFFYFSFSRLLTVLFSFMWILVGICLAHQQFHFATCQYVVACDSSNPLCESLINYQYMPNSDAQGDDGSPNVQITQNAFPSSNYKTVIIFMSSKHFFKAKKILQKHIIYCFRSFFPLPDPYLFHRGFFFFPNFFGFPPWLLNLHSTFFLLLNTIIQH